MARNTLSSVVAAFLAHDSARRGELYTDGRVLFSYNTPLAQYTDNGEIQYSSDTYYIARGYGGSRRIVNVMAGKKLGTTFTRHAEIVRHMLGTRRVANMPGKKLCVEMRDSYDGQYDYSWLADCDDESGRPEEACSVSEHTDSLPVSQ